MTDEPSHEPEYEPKLEETIIYLSLLTLWGITVAIGFVIGEILVVVAAFIFLAILIVVNPIGDKSPFRHPSVDTQKSDIQKIDLKFPYSLVFATVAAVLALGTCVLLMIAVDYWMGIDMNGIEDGLSTIASCMAITVILVLGFVLYIFWSITRHFYNRFRWSSQEFSFPATILAVIIGLVAGSILAALIFSVITA